MKKIIICTSIILSFYINITLAEKNVDNTTWPCYPNEVRKSLYLAAIPGLRDKVKICKETEKGSNYIYLLHANKGDISKIKNHYVLQLSGFLKKIKVLSTGRPSNKTGWISMNQYLSAWGEGPYSFNIIAPNMIVIANSCDYSKALKSYRIKIINKPNIIGNKLNFNFIFLGNTEKNIKLCGVVLSSFNECTPPGKGSHTDWGPCYIQTKN